MTAPVPRPAPGDWLRAFVRVRIVTDAEIMQTLADAQVKLRTQLARIAAAPAGNISEAIRVAQIKTIRKALLRQQAIVMRRTGDVIGARRLEAASRAIDVGNAMDKFIFQSLGDNSITRALIEASKIGLAQTTETAMARMGYSYTGLSDRVYKTNLWLTGRVDQAVNDALARGLTAREFASEAEDWINPATRGGIRYAAMRLARSEINNAFHAVSVITEQDKPWVNGMQWNLSSSHPKPDLCDEYAKEDKFKRGEGIFPKSDVPRKPHPHCFCYVCATLVGEDEFLDALVAGHYDDYIAAERARL